MKVGIVIVVLRSLDYQLLVKSTYASGDDINYYVYYHGRDIYDAKILSEFFSRYNSKVFLHMMNRGLSRSWNDGIINAFNDACEICILANDDCFFEEAAFSFLLDACKESEGDIFYVMSKESSTLVHSGFALAILTPRLVEKIGYFDENFFPAYYEDIDYVIRIRLSGLREVTFSDIIIHHVRNGSTKDDKFREMINYSKIINREYIIRKWGNGAEKCEPTFCTPFLDQKFGLYIPKKQRHAPYGIEFDRSDLRIIDILESSSNIIAQAYSLSVDESNSFLSNEKQRCAKNIQDIRGEMGFYSVPESARCGSTISMQGYLVNSSEQSWYSCRLCPITIGYNWFDCNNEIVFSGRSEFLPSYIEPGKMDNITVILTCPDVQGKYFLRVSLVQEDYAWYCDIGLSVTDYEIVVY